jgi:hypothetical protein
LIPDNSIEVAAAQVGLLGVAGFKDGEHRLAELIDVNRAFSSTAGDL